MQVSSSKEARTLIHKGIRNQFPVLDSRTMDCGNGSDKKQAIRVFLKRKGTFVTTVIIISSLDQMSHKAVIGCEILVEKCT